MELSTFNSLSAAAAAEVVRPCADVPAWVAAVLSGRPYADLDDLLDTADEAARSWTVADLEAALAHHPRIGERAIGDGAEQRHSAAEQGSIADRDASVDAAIAAGNRAYEARFGRVFLIRAAGRSAPEILAALTDRLTHDEATEVAVALDQLREIALLRLEGTVS